MTSLQYSVNQELEKLEDLDFDYRFMALSDLGTMLLKPDNRQAFKNDRQLVDSIYFAVLKRLDDEVSDVQAQAVKCLEPLVAILTEVQLNEVLGLLIKRFKGNPDGASITYMALRTVVSRANASLQVARTLARHICPFLENEQSSNIDSLDVLTDFLKRFGKSVSSDGVSRLEDHLLNVISNGRGIVRKRAVIAMGYLVNNLSQARWNGLMEYIVKNLKSAKDESTRQTLVFFIGVLATADPERIKAALPELFDLVVNALRLDQLDDIGENDEENEGLLDTRENALTALEAFTKLGSTVDPYIEKLTDVVKLFIKYDPNYNADDEDEEEDGDVEMGGSDDDEEFALSDEENFSDDDDQSWKLRRHACRLATSLVQNCSRNLAFIYTQLLDFLVTRVKNEREETVKAEVLSCLNEFIKEAREDGGYYTTKLYTRRRSSDASMVQDNDPRAKLEIAADAMIALAEKECAKANVPTGILHGCLNLVKSLVTVLEEVETPIIGSIANIMGKLSVAKNQMMLDILETLHSVFKHQRIKDFALLTRLLELVITGMKDSHFKVSGEAFEVGTEMFNTLELDSFPDAQHAQDLQTLILENVASNSQDVETREKAVHCLASFLVHSPTPSDQDRTRGMSALVDLLNNETMRLGVISALGTMARSTKTWDTSVVGQSLASLCTFLKKSSRALRMESLGTMREFTQKGAGDDAVATLVLAHGSSCIEGDTFDTQLVNSTCLVLADLCPLVTVTTAISQFAIQVASRKECSQSEKALLQLFRALATNCDTAGFTALYNELESMVESPVGAQAVASVISTGKPDLVATFVNNIKQDQNVAHSLAVLGNVGKHSKIDIDLNAILQRFSSPDEAVQTAAAQAAGDVTINHLEHVPVLVNGLKASGAEQAHLYVVALRAVIGSDKLEEIPLAACEDIWNTLFTLKVEDDTSMVAIAECVGQLSILNPEKCLPQLQQSLKSPEWSSKVIALSAVKYSFSQSHGTYDNLLRPVVIDFLALIEDKDLKARQVAMSTLIAAIHNKSYLLVPHLPMLLPALCKETHIDKDLVRKVRFGPFTHKVDDGLEIRKTAYEAIYTLTSTLSPGVIKQYIDLAPIFKRVLAGLRDEHDIKILCCVITGRIAELNFEVIAKSEPYEEGGEGGVRNITSMFLNTVSKQLKDKAIKQEFEELSEFQRNAVRTAKVMNGAVAEAEKGGNAVGMGDDERQDLEKLPSELTKINVETNTKT